MLTQIITRKSSGIGFCIKDDEKFDVFVGRSSPAKIIEIDVADYENQALISQKVDLRRFDNYVYAEYGEAIRVGDKSFLSVVYYTRA